MCRLLLWLILYPILLMAAQAHSQERPSPQFDAALAEQLGADERGMRSFVLVVLKTGPNKVPAGEKRSQMFRDHLANIQRLADEGKLVFAGPLDGVDGWRGMFILATDQIATAKELVATDPVIIEGEMIAEFHQLYGSAALMMLNEISRKIARPAP
jgi:uncharacterized protein YciI